MHGSIYGVCLEYKQFQHKQGQPSVLHTVPHFDTLKIYSYGKHREKRRNCL